MGSRLILCLAASTLLQAQGPAPYLGQRLPGPSPELFAPGILNVGMAVRDVALSPDGSELYCSTFLPGFKGAAVIWVRRTGDRWSRPEVLPLARDPRWRTLEPCVSPDGRRLFFTSDRPKDPSATTPGPFGLWVASRVGAGWGEPRRLSDQVNGDGEAYFASLTRKGVLYFLREKGGIGRIYRAEPQGEGFAEPVPLPSPISDDKLPANPFVDPDEQMLLYPIFGRPGTPGGGGDYFASFRRADGSWTRPVRLPAPISSEDPDESSITLSPDGKVLFFGSARPRPGGLVATGPLTFQALLDLRTAPGNGHTAIWWVDAGFLRDLRLKTLAADPGP